MPIERERRRTGQRSGHVRDARMEVPHAERDLEQPAPTRRTVAAQLLRDDARAGLPRDRCGIVRRPVVDHHHFDRQPVPLEHRERGVDAAADRFPLVHAGIHDGNRRTRGVVHRIGYHERIGHRHRLTHDRPQRTRTNA
jgi:hypothetical protein